MNEIKINYSLFDENNKLSYILPVTLTTKIRKGLVNKYIQAEIDTGAMRTVMSLQHLAILLRKNPTVLLSELGSLPIEVMKSATGSKMRCVRVKFDYIKMNNVVIEDFPCCVYLDSTIKSSTLIGIDFIRRCIGTFNNKGMIIKDVKPADKIYTDGSFIINTIKYDDSDNDMRLSSLDDSDSVLW